MKQPEPSPCAGCADLAARLARIERHIFGFEHGRMSEADRNSPVARSLEDLVSPRQLENIRREARAAGVNADEECASMFQCYTSELNRAAADKFITHLANLARERRQA